MCIRDRFHRSHGKIATITAVNIGQRFGVLDLEDNGKINSFREKNDDDGSLINGGYMVLNPGVFDYIEGDSNEMCIRDRSEALLAEFTEKYWPGEQQ